MRQMGSIKLARIFGIRIGVHASWFFVLFLFIFLLSSQFKAVLGSSDTVAYATAVASALLFFVSLILHELGHALVARRNGIGISGIDLWLFGGIAKMTRDTDSPGVEFRVAIAGPLVTLGVIALCAGIVGIAEGGSRLLHVAVLDDSSTATPLILLLTWLASINALLFIFNLIPAFPLDGGRIVRAIVWKLTGDRARATRAAAGLGQAFAYVLIGGGIFLALAGRLGDGLWLAVLGMFLGQAARGAVVQTVFAEKLGGVTVADIMDSEPVAVPSTLTAARTQDEFFLRYRWPWFPVVDDAGHYVGILRSERIDGAVLAGDGQLAVGELIDAGQTAAQVGVSASLEALLASEPLRSIGALMAVDAEGRLRGVVTLAQVQRALQAVATPGPAA